MIQEMFSAATIPTALPNADTAAIVKAMRAITKRSRPGVVERKLGADTRVPTTSESLCEACALAHIVRGHRLGEEIVACGFSFPPSIIELRSARVYGPSAEA
jgi:hypothetical protein